MKRRSHWNEEKPSPPCLESALKEKWAIHAMSPPKKEENPFDSSIFLSMRDENNSPIYDLFMNPVISQKQNDDSLNATFQEKKQNFVTLENLLSGTKFSVTGNFEEEITKQLPKTTEKTNSPCYYHPFSIPKPHFLSLSTNVSIPFEAHEFIVFRAFLFDGERQVSEEVEWIPGDFKKFVGKIEKGTNLSNILFEIQQTTPDLIVVVTLSHQISQKSQDFVDFYTKPAEKNQESIPNAKVNNSIELSILQTFGWTCARVTDILTCEEEEFSFPKPQKILQQPKKDMIMRYVDDFETKNAMEFNITMKGKLVVGKCDTEKFKIGRAVFHYNDDISYNFRHKAVFNLHNLTFKADYEYIFSTVSLFNKETQNKALSCRKQFSKKFAYTKFSRAVPYSSLKTVFNEVFVLNMPPDIDDSYAILLELYGINLSTNFEVTPITKKELPLYNSGVYIDSCVVNIDNYPGRNFFSRLRLSEILLSKNFEAGYKQLDGIINESNKELAWSYASTFGYPIDFKNTLILLTGYLPKNEDTIWFILLLALKTAALSADRLTVIGFIDALIKAKKVKHIARFANCLLSTGMVSAAAEIVFRTYRKLPADKANDFYLSVITPLHVAETFLRTEDGPVTFLLACKSKDKRVFQKLLSFFAVYSQELKMELIKAMQVGVSFLLPMENSMFFMYFIESLPVPMFSEWYSHADHSAAFQSLDFMHQRSQLSIMIFIERSLTQHSLPKVTRVMYNLLPKLVTNLFDRFIDFLSQIMKLKQFFTKCDPEIPVFLKRYLELCSVYPKAFSVFSLMYENEKRLFNSITRTRAVLTRTIYLTSSAYLRKCKPLDKPPTNGIYQRIKNFLHVKRNLFKSSKILKYSPDCVVEILLKLADTYHSDKLYAEEIQTRIYVFTYIVVHMIRNKMLINVFSNDHPFSIACPESQNIETVKISASGVFGKHFTEENIEKMGYDIIKLCEESQYYEYGISFINAAEPLCSKVLHISLIDYKDEMQNNMANAKDRFFGSYYKVSVYGQKLKHNNGKSWIIRFPRLSRLSNVVDYYMNHYTKKYGKGVVELIKENKPLDDSYKKKKSKIYLQIIYVEPYGHKVENKETFEVLHNVNMFSFETPFTQSKKAQGSVEEQWIKRTIVFTEYSMPCIPRKSGIVSIKEVDMPPIRVAYRQLKARIKELKEAIINQNINELQILLHGNILVQVNEGPARIAEVFLGKAEYSNSPYVEKLKNIFNDFLDVNRDGIDLHGLLAEDNAAYTRMQVELETQYLVLEETLSVYL